MSRKIYLLMVTLLCFGCVGNHPTKNERDAAMNDIRMVRVVVFVEHDSQTSDALTLVAETSQAFMEQVGIGLSVAKVMPCRFQHRSTDGSINDLLACCDGVDYEIAIGFPSPRLDTAITTLVGGWVGVIEDERRRHIVLKRLNRHTLLHEVAHAFVRGDNHSAKGLLQPIRIELVPGIGLNSSELLSKEDGQEVLRNKWREFKGRGENVR